MKKIYILAFTVALIAGAATFYFATKLDEKSNINNAPTSSVVVALMDIPANTVITEEMVSLTKYTTVSVTPGAAMTLEEVLGKAPKYPIVAGEQIVISKIMTVGSRDSTGSLSFQLEEGKYAYTITVDTLTGISGYICANDYVDIIITKLDETNPEQSKQKASVLFRNIQILKLSNYAANIAAEASGAVVNSYGDVTLCLTLDQCLRLTEEQANGGSIRLVLKSIVSGREEAGEDVTEEVNQEPANQTDRLAG
ncbi:MAG: Flp pilus assembly protein CpaB [Clostridiales bacterium]|nr:Flp pilus assembly protein CpaB [Clostridiales bacterium]